MSRLCQAAFCPLMWVKTDDLYISQPDSGEQALEIADTLINSGVIDVIVIDSVAALVPRAEIDGEKDHPEVFAEIDGKIRESVFPSGAVNFKKFQGAVI